MGALTSLPLCSRAKGEDEVDKVVLPDQPVVAQPSVSWEIAQKLKSDAQEKEVEQEEQTEKKEQDEKEEIDTVEEVTAEADVVDSDQEEIDLDNDKNETFHTSGEDIDLDDIVKNDNEPENENPDEKTEEGDDDTVVMKGKVDTAGAITSLLSELASECESREVVIGR